MECDKCKQDKPDALKRLFIGEVLIARGFYRERTDHLGKKVQVHYDPSLCTACCAEMPGRAWMKA